MFTRHIRYTMHLFRPVPSMPVLFFFFLSNQTDIFAGEAGTDDILSVHPKCTCNCRVHTEACAITQRARRASTWQNRQKVLDSQEDKVKDK